MELITNKEQNKVVLRWLTDKQGKQWSNSHIAEKCNVGAKLVAQIEEEVTIGSHSDIYDPDYERPTKRKSINKQGKCATMETAGGKEINISVKYFQ